MLNSLTPDQRAKLARGWVWQVGHLPARCKARITIVESEGDICVDDPERDIWFAKDELVPDLTDPVTADGLLRTARAMWRDESLHVVPTDAGIALCVVRPRVNGERWRYVWDGETWVRPPAGRSLKVQFQSEPAALLAAILTAPEAA